MICIGHAAYKTQPRRATADGWSSSEAKAKVVTLIFIHTGLLIMFVGKTLGPGMLESSPSRLGSGFSMSVLQLLSLF